MILGPIVECLWSLAETERLMVLQVSKVVSVGKVERVGLDDVIMAE